MVDAVTNNVALIIPATGADVGSWGTAVININMTALDGILGGFATLSLSAATTIALTAPAGSLTPGAGPNQQSNACLFFTGTLTGNAVIQLTVPRLYVMHNKCTVGTSYIQVAPSTGTGTAIGLPPGQKVTLYYDGTNVDYCDTIPVGAALDLHGATALPAWMNACSVAPYLIKDGSVYTSSIYPQLSAQLGSTFGGNGITTFGVPDERARARIGLDTTVSAATSGRLTLAVAGFTGSLMGATGGDQNVATHSHAVTDVGHSHPTTNATTFGGNSFATVGSGGANSGPVTPSNLLNERTGTSTTGVTVNNFGSGVGGNVQPSIVSFLPLIKTG